MQCAACSSAIRPRCATKSSGPGPPSASAGPLPPRRRPILRPFPPSLHASLGRATPPAAPIPAPAPETDVYPENVDPVQEGPNLPATALRLTEKMVQDLEIQIKLSDEQLLQAVLPHAKGLARPPISEFFVGAVVRFIPVRAHLPHDRSLAKVTRRRPLSGRPWRAAGRCTWV